jgi:hypothetical protein
MDTIQKTINYNKRKVELLEAKYPEMTFTKIMDMLMDLGLAEVEDPNSIKYIQTLILDYNKLKISYREFKDEIDNRLIAIETRLK